MKSLLTLMMVLVATLTQAANNTNNVSAQTMRYRNGSLLTFDTTAGLQDEAGAWTLNWTTLNNLSHSSGGTATNLWWASAGTNIFITTNGGATLLTFDVPIGSAGLLSTNSVVRGVTGSGSATVTTNSSGVVNVSVTGAGGDVLAAGQNNFSGSNFFGGYTFLGGTTNHASGNIGIDGQLVVNSLTISLPITNNLTISNATGVAGMAFNTNGNLSIGGTLAVGTYGGLPLRSIGITVDGGGSALTAGYKGDVVMPCAGTLKTCTILGDQAGTVQFEVWRVTDLTTIPTRGGVMGSNYLAGASGVKQTTFTGWTSTSFAQYDRVGFNITTNATSTTRATLQLIYQP